MHAKWWINAHQKMNMVRHNFKLLNDCMERITGLCDDLFETIINTIYENRAAIFRTPDHMRDTPEKYVIV
jgi:hypothetical protein